MRFRDSAMSQSYAQFWSLYSGDHSSRHKLDPVSRIPVANGQFLRSRLHRQYRDRAKITGCDVSHSHVFGRWRVRTCPTHVPVTSASHVTSSVTWAIRAWRKHVISSAKFCTWCSVGLDRESQMNLLPVQRFFLDSPLKFYFLSIILKRSQLGIWSAKLQVDRVVIFPWKIPLVGQSYFSLPHQA